MNSEPATIVGTITGIAAAVVTLVVVFGLALTVAQQAAILGLVAVVAPVLSGIITRSKVYSPDSAARIAQEAGARRALVS